MIMKKFSCKNRKTKKYTINNISFIVKEIEEAAD